MVAILRPVVREEPTHQPPWRSQSATEDIAVIAPRTESLHLKPKDDLGKYVLRIAANVGVRPDAQQGA